MAKYSRQRELILDVVMENRVHPTADYVYNKLKPDYPDLSLGTVYRNLNLLAEQGQITKVKVTDGPDRFDANLEHHYHMKCKTCGQLIDLKSEYLDDLDRRLSETTGNRILSHRIDFEGICGGCAVKPKQEN